MDRAGGAYSCQITNGVLEEMLLSEFVRFFLNYSVTWYGGYDSIPYLNKS